VTGLPADLVDALLDDVTATFSVRDDVPPMTLRATDRPATWTITGDGAPTEVTGTAPALLGWLTGRSADGVEPALPAPRWL
jgi:maleylpyruvate isomerase